MDLRAGQLGHTRADADADTLDRLDGHQRLGETPVELTVPLHVAAEPDRQAAHDHLEAAADGVPSSLRRIDDAFHLLFDVGIDAVQLGVGGDGQHVFECHGERVADRRRPDVDDVRDDADAELSEKLLADGTDRHARRRFTRAGALEDVADIGVVVFHDAGEVDVAGARPRDGRAVVAGRLGRRRSFHGHRPLPVLPVLIGNHQRDRRTRGHAVTDAANDVGAIGFDDHAATATISALAAPEFGAECREVDREPGRNTFEDGDEGASMGLAGREKAQHLGDILSEKSAWPRAWTRVIRPETVGRRSCTPCLLAGGYVATHRRSVCRRRSRARDRSRHGRTCLRRRVDGRRADGASALGRALCLVRAPRASIARAIGRLRRAGRDAALRGLGGAVALARGCGRGGAGAGARLQVPRRQ